MIPDLTPYLKDWVSTIGLLAIGATVLLLVMVYSVRQFSLWFLKINEIVDRQEKILDALHHIESQQRQGENPTPEIFPQPPLSKTEQFKLNH